MLHQRSTPMLAPAPVFPRPLLLPPLDCSHPSHPCPRLTPLCRVQQSFPRMPAQMPNFFRLPLCPSPANSLLHRQSAPLGGLDSLFATLPVALANSPRPSPPASHPSNCRNKSQIPRPPPRSALDEKDHPSPAAIKR